MKRICACAAVTLSAVLSAPLYAYEAGSFIVRGGAATVSPDVSSSALSLSGSELTGTGAAVDDGTALGLTGVYMLRDHWGLELVAASPFSHDIQVEGLGEPLDLGETKHLPPTLLVQWYPLQPNSAVQPYVGLGVNYTAFFDEKVDRNANDFFSSALGANDSAELSLKNSFGLAAEAGVDFAFGPNQRWLFNASVWWMDIDTEAKVKVPGVGTIMADVELDPLVYMAGLGYRF
ncbi:outer membrane protein [Microbulbifer donghaiensis]|uniref:Outer membrane protein n=1 Tax=Microbulbifer donghaiensis TaxID=494016 RepID=A0A1M4ZFX7_9GAMM|nr:OmpW family outer membrane protein [Microbulbifer donghaiensis]SHF16885.1 outer membrane protein [Microbulbifer donghaiensis]